MKIGDRIYVRGYIDEIRKDTVIVRNDGGYFGTVLSEVTGELPSAQPDVPDIYAGDMISRQDAIDALDGELEITGRTNAEAVKGYVRLVKDRLERLPSAQPDVPDTNVGDMISRRDAIDALNTQAEEMSHWHERYAEQRKGILTAVRIVSDIKPKRGKWIPEYKNPCYNGYYKIPSYCSCCKDYYTQSPEEMNFCPHCGADMRTKETDCDYERAVEQLEHDMLYEPTFDPDDGSM